MAGNMREDHIVLARHTDYIVNHVFLPSKLPQQDDYDEQREEALLVVVLEALRTFEEFSKDCDPPVIKSITDSLQTLQLSKSNRRELAIAFNDCLIKKDGTLVFHVKEQNAGIMFTRSGSSVHVEVFELSANNQSVMSTKGRLRRVFPAEFRVELAPPNTKPQVTKAGQKHEEDRDTTHPKMVTDFLSAILSSLGKPVEVKQILKHTREEVLWDDCVIPWHRSALWLLIRLKKCPRQTYKTFMLDLLSAMSSKLSRRCQKVAGYVPEPAMQLVESSLSEINAKLQERWSQIQIQSQVPYDMGFLKDRNFENDTQLQIPELDHFLDSIDSQEEGNGGSNLRISTPLDIHYPADMPYKLAAVEFWVAHHLPRWIQLILRNPETTSMMILTIMELWIASDKSAVQILPMELFENLNLPLKEQMERLQESSHEIFSAFGSRHCFSELRAKIEKNAEIAREKKREEFRNARTRFHELMRLSNDESHQYTNTVDQITGDRSRANNLEIVIHEWPLSSMELEAKSTVFELRVPPFYGHWRDTTIFILYNVLGSQYSVKKTPNSVNELTNSLTKDYFQAFGSKPRIILLSEVKSHTRSHRNIRNLCLQGGEDDICLENGLRYKYYDESENCFVADLEISRTVPELCTYSISSKSTGQTSSIQQFIDRPASKPHGPSPNTVLASQSDCPLDLSLEEYKALTSLPLGSNIQWQNILVQLAMPSVDLKKEETALVILQCIFQAGPRIGSDILRTGHRVLADKSFARALLGCLHEALERVRENWQSFQALGVLVAISRRLLSLTPAEDTRDAALKWIEVLDEKIHNVTDDEIRSDLRYKTTRVAFICADTFNIDDGHLHLLLSSLHGTCTMIRCSIVIQEGLRHVPNTAEGLERIMRQRWDRLSYRSFYILSDQIINKKNLALNNAVWESWPDFHPTNDWRVMNEPYHHWLETSSKEENNSFSVHISLPLSRLPKEYEMHEMYQTLFGESVLEAFPSSVSGMRFALKKTFNGHRNLYVCADIEGAIFEVVPLQTFAKYLPTAFVNNFVHWYNESEDYVEFRARELPWDHSKENWRLVCLDPSEGRWKLVRENSSLINMNSGLEKPLWIHIIFHESSLDIELPHLKLGFYTTKGETMISSRQFRGMVVDENQLIGTLTGLCSKLVLRGRQDGVRRKVIIPGGEIVFSKNAQHVLHVYEVDDLLGRLIDNKSLQSRLLISYFHALTSYPLPDTLTGKTVRSFKCLTEEDISLLQDIAKLTPSRTVTWSQDLGVYFHYPESNFKIPKLQLVNKTLLHRDLIRSSSFRIIGSGAEDFTKEHDVDYHARDRETYSPQAYKTFSISSMVLEPEFRLCREVRSDIGSCLWEFTERNAKTSDLRYNAKFLLDSNRFIAEQLPRLHKLLSDPDAKPGMFKIMFWLSTLAYDPDPDMTILQIVASFFIDTFNRLNLPQQRGESDRDFKNRKSRLHRWRKNAAVSSLASALEAQWPCETPSPLDVAIVQQAKQKFKLCFDNHQLVQYFNRIGQNLARERPEPPSDFEARSMFPKNAAVLSAVAPEVLPGLIADILSPSYNESNRTPRLPTLLSILTDQAQSESSYSLPLGMEEIKPLLVPYCKDCQELVDNIYNTMRETLEGDLRHRNIPSQHWPRLCPIFFLERLSHCYWESLPETWKKCIVHYGVAITRLQRAQRLLKELQNPGHMNWNPEDLPDSLLLEIESDLMIREVQEQIAMHMRSPESGRNSVMQLNMGEGKSSVIVPAVAAALADGKKMMFQMLVSKLGGLLDRRIYHMPFSRAVKVGHEEIKAMLRMSQECRVNGGVFLVQPEHILSFKLMGIECISTQRGEIGRSLAQLQVDNDSNTRDIVDESDENFSVKSSRWICIHQLLDIVRTVVAKAHSELPRSVELRFNAFGCFPWTRILRADVADMILHQIAIRIGEIGLNGFSITRQPAHIRDAVYKYITEPEPGADIISLIEDESPSSFWMSSKDTLLLLRGLIAGGVLAFAFGHKRWRVDYGLDTSRNPPTKLAVPYRAKDSPSPRSEFSHPDAVILLTSLSYYYGGLSDEDLVSAFNHLFKSDQAEIEYGLWVKTANNLDASFRQLVGINLEDSQCTEHVFKNLRFVKEVIDYFMAYIVFPKEMREFPHKLSASGWDLGEVKAHPTTGFSGTNDSRKVLPLEVEQLDLENQKHTNALVLEYLLQPENSVELIPPHREEDESVAETLLDIITKMDPPTRVILDVGAQILELDNVGVATKWLQKNSDDKQIRAAIYFDNNDELRVIDREGYTESLQVSPYSTQLGSCLVFLDEAHTRGTDLKLPKDYRAAVTLGANLTKDRLVQACMRMRMLGQGQSVVFCVPEEIQAKIRARTHKTNSEEISVLDILSWTIGETWADIHRSMGLWVNQGRRHEKHLKIWEQVKATDSNGKGIIFDKSLAEDYLEDESQTLERRYRPRTKGNDSLIISSDEATLDPISKRCREFANLNVDASALQEEEERELSPEVEQEREDQRPAAAKPAVHSIPPGVRAFIKSCTIKNMCDGYNPAFTSLQDTTAARDHFYVRKFPTGLLVSADFEQTIARYRKGVDTLDFYQRSVQWILTGGLPNQNTVKYMMVISPYEAQALLPEIQASDVVALHLYAPKSTLAYHSLDALDLYTVPERLSKREIPQRLITELNLFAGQLYFNSYEQYVDACKFMGISYDTPGEGEVIAADGFILRDALGRVGGESRLTESPVNFFKMLHTKIRRNCESISKTHMGKLLDNQLLKPEDFMDGE
ncbi:hypothetical protein F4806DRAFT_488627 [Annulohypoxylon nitens]|nr:hypothetical protein F4806DRAFT_488627 [Annulohypoxylon nitens]